MGADEQREWGAFDPGNVGAYPGRVVRVQPGSFDEGILDIRATDDRGVQLTTIVLGSWNANNAVDTLRTAFARIGFGVAGGRDEIWCDYLHGQCVTVPASFIRTTAYYPIGNVNPPGWPPFTPDPENFGVPFNPQDDPAGADAQALFLSANIAPQPHPQAAFGATPRLTIYVNVPAGDPQDPSGSAYIRVPPHAQSVTILSNNNVWEPSLISAHTLPTPTSSLYAEDAPITINDSRGAFPIARGVEYVRLWNDTNADQLALLLFTIGL